MSDRENPVGSRLDRDDIGAVRQTSRERATGGFVSGILLQVLKWIAIAIVAVVFIVTVVIVTVNRLAQRGAGVQDTVQLSSEFSAQPPILEWYSEINEVRGATADPVRQTFIVVAHIGYDKEDRAVQTELVERTIQIRELIHFYFGSRLAEDLRGIENRQRVKADLTRQVNRIMRNGTIRDVAFDQYDILDF